MVGDSMFVQVMVGEVKQVMVSQSMCWEVMRGHVIVNYAKTEGSEDSVARWGKSKVSEWV